MRRTGATVVATIVLLGGVVAACLLPHTDELAGGGSDASTAGDSTDGRADVAPDAPGSCDATFCDDFDKGPLGAAWTTVNGLDAGLMTLGQPAVSPPNALVISQPDGGGTQQKTPMLVKDLPKGSSLRCSFTVLGESLPPNSKSAGDVLSFLYAGNGTFVDDEILLSLDKTGLGLREDVGLLDGGCDCPRFFAGPFPISTALFTRVALVTDFVTARILVNDVEVASHAVTGAGATQVRVSFGYDRPAGPSKVRFDDFACTVTP